MLEEIFRGKCPVCGGLCGLQEPLCPDCFGSLEELGPPCPQCGFPLAAEGAFCPSCAGKTVFSCGRVYACYRYAGVIRELLLKVKFSYNLRSAFTFRRVLKVPEGLNMDVYDAIVPVPSHFLRRLRRFRHPAEAAAKYLGEVSGKPVLNVLYRKRDTVFQYKLDKTERRSNVNGAFGVRFSETPSSILLVDDIFTTGSTLGECAGTLKASGVLRTDCCVIAID